MSNRKVYLQWHLTAQCPLHCQHCYLYDARTYSSELDHELSLRDCLRVLQSFEEYLSSIGARGHIAFSGGDVFLRENVFWSLAELAVEAGISFSVLGNPDLLTGQRIALLRDLGAQFYQISLDGLQSQHDTIRRPGSFVQSVSALCMLRKEGIPTSVMFTLNRANADDLIPVMDLAANIGVSRFGFDRVAGVGAGRGLIQDPFSPAEYRAICEAYLDERLRLRQAGYATRFALKSNLLQLVRYERGDLQVNSSGIDDCGCPIGGNLLALLSDGTALACRRIPISVGRVPQQSITAVFASPELDRFRQRALYTGCGDCALYLNCRGCPAVALGATSDLFARDPQCWKHTIVQMQTQEERW